MEAVAAMPESFEAAEAAPLPCLGITTFNALRHSGALPGDLVAVQGIGGLGHLGIQFAQKFGYKVAAIGRGPDNAVLAKKLGASIYIDSAAMNAAGELQKLGGARVILATSGRHPQAGTARDRGVNDERARPAPAWIEPARVIAYWPCAPGSLCRAAEAPCARPPIGGRARASSRARPRTRRDRAATTLAARSWH